MKVAAMWASRWKVSVMFRVLPMMSWRRETLRLVGLFSCNVARVVVAHSRSDLSVLFKDSVSSAATMPSTVLGAKQRSMASRSGPAKYIGSS